MIAWTLQIFSSIIFSLDPTATSRLLGAAYAYYRSFSTNPFELSFRRRMSRIIKSRIGEEAFNKAFAEGEKMSIKEAIQFAKSLVEKL